MSELVRPSVNGTDYQHVADSNRYQALPQRDFTNVSGSETRFWEKRNLLSGRTSSRSDFRHFTIQPNQVINSSTQSSGISFKIQIYVDECRAAEACVQGKTFYQTFIHWHLIDLDGAIVEASVA